MSKIKYEEDLFDNVMCDMCGEIMGFVEDELFDYWLCYNCGNFEIDNLDLEGVYYEFYEKVEGPSEEEK